MTFFKKAQKVTTFLSYFCNKISYIAQFGHTDLKMANYILVSRPLVVVALTLTGTEASLSLSRSIAFFLVLDAT